MAAVTHYRARFGEELDVLAHCRASGTATLKVGG
jgi:hypothetical protein